ncbi:hypothetical protein [Mesorhizobium sp. YR577]|uniref:hypothetical protein n=1 Tax=Mesorhizobium sp. YR577 TaxID=1884373 RepID=UPI000B871770|nr:hypothetical protein [Mesorhizobium sp. YR577]
MEQEFWSIRRIALVGALIGAAFGAPEFFRNPSAANLGGLTAYMMIGAIIIAVAARVLLRRKR